MDERLWLFFNDVDWALRIRKAGLELWYLDEAEVVHHLGASTKRYTDFGAEWHRNRIAFYRKHWGFVGRGALEDRARLRGGPPVLPRPQGGRELARRVAALPRVHEEPRRHPGAVRTREPPALAGPMSIGTRRGWQCQSATLLYRPRFDS